MTINIHSATHTHTSTYPKTKLFIEQVYIKTVHGNGHTRSKTGVLGVLSTQSEPTMRSVFTHPPLPGRARMGEQVNFKEIVSGSIKMESAKTYQFAKTKEHNRHNKLNIK